MPVREEVTWHEDIGSVDDDARGGGGGGGATGSLRGLPTGRGPFASRSASAARSSSVSTLRGRPRRLLTVGTSFRGTFLGGGAKSASVARPAAIAAALAAASSSAFFWSAFERGLPLPELPFRRRVSYLRTAL